MESKRSSGNYACANRTADAAGRGWNAALAEQSHRQPFVGERYFVGSFLENELAQSLEGYWTLEKLKGLKKLQT